MKQTSFESEELRLYTFINWYLSSIQQSIQSAHLVSELFVKKQSKPAQQLLLTWAESHKTIITLNGGNFKKLMELFKVLSSGFTAYPWAVFNEDNDSLGGVMTGVGIVLPESIFGAQDYRTTVRNIHPASPVPGFRTRSFSEIPAADLEQDYFYERHGDLHQIYREFSDKHSLIKFMRSCRLAQ